MEVVKSEASPWPCTPGSPAEVGLPIGWAAHVDPKTNKTFYFNYINGQSQWDKPAAPVKQPEAETAEGKATVEVKQEERLKDYKKAASASAAKAVRVGNNDAMRKAEKEAALTAKRAAALVADPLTSPTEAAMHAADAASAASVTIHSDDDDDSVGDDEAATTATTAEGMIGAEVTEETQLFPMGAAR